MLKVKICSSCKLEKDINEFGSNKNKRDGLQLKCKECTSIYMKEWKLKVNFKENRKAYDKIYCENNKDKILANKRIRSKTDKYREVQNKRIRERLKTDLKYRFKRSVYKMIHKAFKINGYTKNAKLYNIIGCSFDFLNSYLESKFSTWMNWNNKGLYNGNPNYGWDIDHIVPLSLAKNNEDFIKLLHYRNLQPLCSYINRDVKKNNYNEIFEIF